MKHFFYRTLEKILNQYLALDPESKQRLLLLNNKTISIILPIFDDRITINDSPSPKKQNITIALHILHGHIHVTQDTHLQPDVVIKGSPLSLLHMSVAKENRKQFFTKDVVIEGDLELGQQIIDLFDKIDIDWEEHISHLIGDVPAHHFGRLVRSINQFVNRANKSLMQNINEYIHEEAMVFPPKEAIQDFFHDIDTLRMDADRLEIRVQQLFKNKKSTRSS